MIRTGFRHGVACALVIVTAACGDDSTGAGGEGGGTTTSTGTGTTVATTTTATTTTVTTGSSGDGGGTGQGGDVTSAQGGGSTTGTGGAGGNAPSCTEITLEELTFGGGPYAISATFSPSLGGADDDAAGITHPLEENAFDLASAINDNFATCEACVAVFEDTDGTLEGTGRIYFQSGGTLSVAEGADGFPAATVGLVGVTLVEVTLDADQISEPVPGGACLTIVDDSFDLAPPPVWTCSPTWYDAADGCDCECGIPDPDCDLPDQQIFRCGPPHVESPGTSSCDDQGQCIAPDAWTCAADAFVDQSTCDCDCGVEDPDCLVAQPLPVEGCVDADALCVQGACVTIPQGWTCPPGFYDGDGFCDCNCGAYDPDCDDPGAPILGCGPDQECTPQGECGVPSSWTCADAAFNDGVTCDCACGANDPDCVANAPVNGCDAGDVCVDDTCVTPAANDSCAGAIPLTEGTVAGSWVGATNGTDPGPLGCTGFVATGADVIYSVSLLAGETLTVTIDQPTNGADSALYLLSDCADADTCVDGADTIPPEVETLTHTATANEDLFLVVDQYGLPEAVPFSLSVDIQ